MPFVECIVEELIKDFKCLFFGHTKSLSTGNELLNEHIIGFFKVSDCLFSTTTLHLQNLISFRPFQPTNVNCNSLYLFLIHHTSISLFQIFAIRKRLINMSLVNLISCIDFRHLQAKRSRSIHSGCCNYIFKAIGLNYLKHILHRFLFKLEYTITIAFTECLHDFLIIYPVFIKLIMTCKLSKLTNT